MLRKYSANQKVGSFHYIHRTPFGNYSFICADATLTPGPKRPYNFFGIISQVGEIILAYVNVMTTFPLSWNVMFPIDSDGHVGNL